MAYLVHAFHSKGMASCWAKLLKAALIHMFRRIAHPCGARPAQYRAFYLWSNTVLAENLYGPKPSVREGEPDELRFRTVACTRTAPRATGADATVARFVSYHSVNSFWVL